MGSCYPYDPNGILGPPDANDCKRAGGMVCPGKLGLIQCLIHLKPINYHNYNHSNFSLKVYKFITISGSASNATTTTATITTTQGNKN